MRKFWWLTALCAAVLLISSCSVSELDWDADLIGPLAFSSMRLEDVKELNGLERSIPFTVGDMHIPIPPPGDIPPIQIPDQGPITIKFFYEFYYVEVDSVNLTVAINNNLPVDIDSGGVVEFSNKVAGDIIYSYRIPVIIPKNTNYTFNIIVADKRMEEDIELMLKGFSTLAEDNATITSDNSVTLTLSLDFISISKASVKRNTVISISDTADFSLQGEDLNVVSISGIFNAYVENGFPFSGELQAYFLSEGGGTLYDSLFQEAVILMPALNANGEVIEPLETKIVIEMDTARVNRILEAKEVYFTITLKAPDSEPLIADNKYPLKAQLVGDLHVKIEN